MMIAFIENSIYVANEKTSTGTTNSLRLVVVIFNLVMIFFVVKFYRKKSLLYSYV